MNITIGLPEILTAVIAVVGLLGWIFKQLFASLLRQFEQKLSDRFKSFDARFDLITNRLEAIEEDAREWTRLERDLLGLKAEMPLHYVRREDYVRNQTVIESKLDALAVKLENWQLKEVAK